MTTTSLNLEMLFFFIKQLGGIFVVKCLKVDVITLKCRCAKRPSCCKKAQKLDKKLALPREILDACRTKIKKTPISLPLPRLDGGVFLCRRTGGVISRRRR